MFFFLLALFPVSLQAYNLEQIQSHAFDTAVSEVSSQYEHFKISALPMDRRTSNSWSCSHEPVYSMATSSLFLSRISVHAQCQQPRWSLLIPFRNEIFEEVAILDTSIRFGEVLSLGDINWRKKDILKLRGQHVDKSNVNMVLGRKAKRNLAAGDLIQINQWKVANVLKRNQHVTLIFKNNGITVTTKGKVLESGHIGKKVLVENLKSGIKLQGVIRDPDTVEIT